MNRRVVVTGMAAITPLGTGVDRFWQGLKEGRSGIGPLTRFDPSSIEVKFGGEVRDFDPSQYMDRKEARRLDRFAQFSVAGASMALEDAGLRTDDIDPDRAGVILGSGIGGMETLDDQFATLHQKGPGRISPFMIPMMIANSGAAQVSMLNGLRGPCQTIVTACASANNAIGEAKKSIERGDVDLVVTGGAEAALVPISFAGFINMKALSTRNETPERASRPFDIDRDGFVMSEGAGVLILEELEHARKRGARIHAELVGYGSTADAHHITEPAPDGSGGARAMLAALRDAGLSPEQVDYINAHGTGTPKGDVLETTAIKNVFGDHAYRLPVSSTKSMTGHLLGATGAIELIACIKAIHDRVLPPTINLDHPDPECDLDYVPHRSRAAKVDVALSNSFGFGGHNATLIVRRYVA